jgi:hypothetical protein
MLKRRYRTARRREFPPRVPILGKILYVAAHIHDLASAAAIKVKRDMNRLLRRS